MPDERTCRTCWHWDVVEPGQGLCGHLDTGGAVHGADDTCCNHLAIVGRGGDWQPHEQLGGGSAPAEDWREPMVDASNSSTPPEIGSPPPGRWSDAWKRAAKRERRAVDKLAEHIEIACEGFAHGGMSAMEVAPGGYTDATEIAAWARNRARGESGE